MGCVSTSWGDENRVDERQVSLDGSHKKTARLGCWGGRWLLSKTKKSGRLQRVGLNQDIRRDA